MAEAFCEAFFPGDVELIRLISRDIDFSIILRGPVLPLKPRSQRLLSVLSTLLSSVWLPFRSIHLSSTGNLVRPDGGQRYAWVAPTQNDALTILKPIGLSHNC